MSANSTKGDAMRAYDDAQALAHNLVYEQAHALAERLNLGASADRAVGRWERLIFPAMLTLLDRIEKLEAKK